jgi:hypothetical protein
LKKIKTEIDLFQFLQGPEEEEAIGVKSQTDEIAL